VLGAVWVALLGWSRIVDHSSDMREAAGSEPSSAQNEREPSTAKAGSADSRLRQSQGSEAAAPTVAAGSERPTTQVADSADDDWQSLKERADAGDVNAGCKLSLALEGCRRAAELRWQIDSELQSMRFDDPASRDAAMAERLAANSEEAAGYAARCGGAPREVALQEWQYLLAAAQAGHEPSMYRFAMFPPIDGERPLEYTEAIAAYKRYAQQFIDELVRRGSAEGLLAAFLVAGGHTFIGQSPLSPRDPKKMVQYGAALSILRNRPAILDSAIANVAGSLTQSEVDTAIAEGRGMAGGFRFRFLADGQKSVDPERSKSTCDKDW
jgi:hypothetical protein